MVLPHRLLADTVPVVNYMFHRIDQAARVDNAHSALLYPLGAWGVWYVFLRVVPQEMVYASQKVDDGSERDWRYCTNHKNVILVAIITGSTHRRSFSRIEKVC